MVMNSVNKGWYITKTHHQCIAVDRATSLRVRLSFLRIWTPFRRLVVRWCNFSSFPGCSLSNAIALFRGSSRSTAVPNHLWMVNVLISTC